MKFTVTKANIAAGIRKDAWMCPIAKAVNAKFKTDTGTVRWGVIEFLGKDRKLKTYILPEKAKRFHLSASRRS